MQGTVKPAVVRILKIAIALMPWLASTWVFYWLEASGTWVNETPHRGKMSVVLLGTGMGASFLLYSWLIRKKSR